MTRSQLLCDLLEHNHQSADRLTGRYGKRWREPMRSLIDLGLVIEAKAGEDSKTAFHIVPWRGQAGMATRVAA